MKPFSEKYQYLIEQCLITPSELKKAYTDAHRQQLTVENVLMSRYKISKAEIGISLSQYYEVPYADLNEAPTPIDILKNIKISFLINRVMVPVMEDKDRVCLAIDDPLDKDRINLIKPLYPQKMINVCVALKDDILKFIRSHIPNDIEYANINDILKQLKMGDEDLPEETPSERTDKHLIPTNKGWMTLDDIIILLKKESNEESR